MLGRSVMDAPDRGVMDVPDRGVMDVPDRGVMGVPDRGGVVGWHRCPGVADGRGMV
jgi:hypothetical protein